MAPLGIFVLVRWTKTHQSVGRTPVLLISGVLCHPADTVAAYFCQLQPTSAQIYTQEGHLIIMMVPMLSRALSVMVDALGRALAFYSLHIPMRGVAQQHTDRALTK